MEKVNIDAHTPTNFHPRCYVRIDGEYPKIKKDLVYSGQIKLTPNPPGLCIGMRVMDVSPD